MTNEKIVFMLSVDPDDIFLTSSTLDELGQNIPIRFLSSSAEMFAALKEQMPSLIVLDYNIEPEPGVKVLSSLKSDRSYSAIPVVILTDSPRWEDYAECYRQGASTVIKKPNTSKMTSGKIKTFFDYWVNVAETYKPEVVTGAY